MAGPSRSGTASPEAVLRRVELRVARRLDGILQGERRGRRPGPGGEAALTRAYEDGDDVRWVDWPLGARRASRWCASRRSSPSSAWALVELSPSMAFGTLGQTKDELAREVLAGLGIVMRRRATASGWCERRRPRPRAPASRRPPGADRAIAAVNALPARARGRWAHRPGAGDHVAGRIARHRGAVVLISDFPLQPGLERAVGGLARRHDVVAIELRDRREREIPHVGPMELRDLETGRRRLIDTADPRFQDQVRRGRRGDRPRPRRPARAGRRPPRDRRDGPRLGAAAGAVARPAPLPAAVRVPRELPAAPPPLLALLAVPLVVALVVWWRRRRPAPGIPYPGPGRIARADPGPRCAGTCRSPWRCSP